MALAALEFSVATAHAHDPFEITTVARLHPDTLVLDVTMARSAALAIANEASEAPTFAPADFDALRPRFLARAPALLGISAGGVSLAPRDVAVGLGVEQDVEFHLTFPRPASGVLRLEFPPLARLGAGFGNMLQVRSDDGASLGEKLLTAEDRSLDVALPAIPSSGRQAPRPAAAAPRPFRIGPAVISLIVIAAGFLWLQRRRPVGQ